MLELTGASGKHCNWYIVCINQTIIITGFHFLQALAVLEELLEH